MARRRRRAPPPPPPRRRLRRAFPTRPLALSAPARRAVRAAAVAAGEAEPVALDFDLRARQDIARDRATYYAPMVPIGAQRAADINPEFTAALGEVTGVDVGGALDELQGTAQSILNVAGDVLGIDLSPGFSGGVDAREAAYIYAPSGATSAGILERNRRLNDIEGTTGEKDVATTESGDEFIAGLVGSYQRAGGLARGGRGRLVFAAEPDVM